MSLMLILTEETDYQSRLWASWRMPSAIANYLENLSAFVNPAFATLSTLPIPNSQW